MSPKSLSVSTRTFGIRQTVAFIIGFGFDSGELTCRAATCTTCDRDNTPGEGLA